MPQGNVEHAFAIQYKGCFVYLRKQSQRLENISFSVNEIFHKQINCISRPCHGERNQARFAGEFRGGLNLAERTGGISMATVGERVRTRITVHNLVDVF